MAGYRSQTICLALAAVALTGGCATAPPPSAPSLVHIEDAERFAVLLSSGPPSASALQRGYLDPGSIGIEIFTPHRIQNADNLAANVVANLARYQHAAAVCLPAARQIEPRATAVLQRTATLLGEGDNPASAYFLFGANNSGGTADERALAIGLEVVCHGKSSAEDAARVFEEFLAHEVVHVYQARARANAGEISFDLLYAALNEGVADFVMELSLDRATDSNSARNAYGLAHEREMWRAFLADYRPGEWRQNSWFYGPGAEGRPADMGYWIGQRIAEAYYEQATDKSQALRDLLELRDPAAILARSGYGRGW